jgi:proteasome accessory factor C
MTRTADRLHRILRLVPWVLARPEAPTVAETCAQFDITRSQLLDDLGLLLMCGVHPFTPDALIETGIEGDRVVIQSDWFTRMPRPEPGEALALVAAARAVAQTPDAPPALLRGLQKLEAALPGRLADSLLVDLDAPEELPELRRAVDEGLRLEIDYWSYARDALTARRVDPASVLTARGHWYLTGWCHLAGGPRSFRIDRIRRLAVTDEAAERATEAAGIDPVYEAGDADLRVTIRLTPAGRWLGDYYPLESEEDLADGGARVVLATGSPQWLTRLLVRLGPEATVEEPASVAEAAAEAAARILRRYEGS